MMLVFSLQITSCKSSIYRNLGFGKFNIVFLVIDMVFGNNTDNSKKDEMKDYKVLKTSIAEGILLAGLGFACGDGFASKDVAKNVSKSNPIGEKILFGTMAACILVTAVQAVKAIRHYINDKKNNSI